MIHAFKEPTTRQLNKSSGSFRRLRSTTGVLRTDAKLRTSRNVEYREMRSSTFARHFSQRREKKGNARIVRSRLDSGERKKRQPGGESEPTNPVETHQRPKAMPVRPLFYGCAPTGPPSQPRRENATRRRCAPQPRRRRKLLPVMPGSSRLRRTASLLPTSRLSLELEPCHQLNEGSRAPEHSFPFFFSSASNSAGRDARDARTRPAQCEKRSSTRGEQSRSCPRTPCAPRQKRKKSKHDATAGPVTLNKQPIKSSAVHGFHTFS